MSLVGEGERGGKEKGLEEPVKLMNEEYGSTSGTWDMGSRGQTLFSKAVEKASSGKSQVSVKIRECRG